MSLKDCLPPYFHLYSFTCLSMTLFSLNCRARPVFLYLSSIACLSSLAFTPLSLLRLHPSPDVFLVKSPFSGYFSDLISFIRTFSHLEIHSPRKVPHPGVPPPELYVTEPSFPLTFVCLSLTFPGFSYS